MNGIGINIATSMRLYYIRERISVNQICMTFDAMNSFHRPDFTDLFQAHSRRSINAVRDFEMLNSSII